MIFFKLRNHFLIIIALFLSVFASAQNDLKIGQWKSYLPYRTAKYVTQSKDKVYYATQYSVLSYDKNNNEIDFLSKVEGLSDAGVQMIKYNRFSDILFIAYDNSNIDLLKKDGTVQNVRDILSNTNIIGDKKIYDIYIENATNIYLACGFGVVKFNIVKGEFDFTTFTNLKVRSVSVLDGYLYIVTDNGIYRALNDSKLNLADFKTWTFLGKNQGFPSGYRCSAICSTRGKLYLGINDSLCVWENNNLKSLQYVGDSYNINNISAEGKNILYSFVHKNENQKWDGKLGYINEKEEVTLISNNNCINNIFNAVEDEKGTIWLADVGDKFKRLENISGTNAACKDFSTNSPYSASTSEVAIADDNSLWVASGTVVNGGPRDNYNGFYRYFDGKWSYKNSTNDDVMKNAYLQGAKNGQAFTKDCHRVIVNKTTKKGYIGSYWSGLLDVSEDGKPLKLFSGNNSALQRTPDDTNSTRVGGMAFDKKGTLWIANTLSPKSVVALTSDGKWYAMGANIGRQYLSQCVIDPVNGYKWFAIANNGGLLVYDEGKDIATENDDRSLIINTSNSRLPSNNVNCLEVDLDGRIWVGTDNGVIYFSCGSSLFDKKDACKGFLPIATVDGIPEYLLRYNSVNTIAVDGANRKWFGTANGFFIQSGDGVEQIAYYNKSNSPLFDDNINDIAINNRTGEVFIATSKGLQSLKSDATAGSATASNVLVYPNPVRPEYEGLIAIKGLAEDSKVKITDINGRLVYETEALGGQAVWDGKDYNGQKAETGVYYVFSTYIKNLDYPSSAAAKVLLVK